MRANKVFSTSTKPVVTIQTVFFFFVKDSHLIFLLCVAHDSS